MVSLIPDETLSALKERYSARFIENNVSPSELQALATAHLENEVSNTRLQELLTDHPVEITRMLQGLCTLGVLESDNRRRWSRYYLSGGGITAPTLFDTLQSDKDSIRLPGDSSHLDEVNVELQKLAEPVSSKGKAPVSLVREVIFRLCTGRYLSAEELSRLLNRSQHNIRNRHLTLMVTEGLLTLRYPDSVNRPDQAYTATDKDAQ